MMTSPSRPSTILRRLTATAALAGFGAVLSTPAQAVDVGVSVEVSKPGVYGRVDVGRFPQPQVIVQQPVWGVLRAPQVAVAPQPVYMWVPPGHRKKWSKHCSRYNACGVPVYFVQDRWYQQQVMQGAPMPRPVYRAPEPQRWDGDDRRGPRGRGEPGEGRGRGHGEGKGQGQGHGRGHGKGDD